MVVWHTGHPTHASNDVEAKRKTSKRETLESIRTTSKRDQHMNTSLKVMWKVKVDMRVFFLRYRGVDNTLYSLLEHLAWVSLPLDLIPIKCSLPDVLPQSLGWWTPHRVQAHSELPWDFKLPKHLGASTSSSLEDYHAPQQHKTTRCC